MKHQSRLNALLMYDKNSINLVAYPNKEAYYDESLIFENSVDGNIDGESNLISFAPDVLELGYL